MKTAKSFFKKNPVRLSGRKYTEFRQKVFEKYAGICQVCFNYAPIRDHDGQFSFKTCGHVSHIKGVGSGGSDTIDNVTWKCYDCHIIGEHGLKFNSRGSGL